MNNNFNNNDYTVSCVSASYCVAVDEVGNAMSYDGTSWGSVDHFDTGVADHEFLFLSHDDVLHGARCQRPRVHLQRDQLERRDGRFPPRTTRPCSRFHAQRHRSASRPTAKATRIPTRVPPGRGLFELDSTSYPTSLSCATATFCEAVDNAGNAFSYDGSSWRSQGDIDANSPSGLNQFGVVSCASETFCVAADYAGATLI